MDPPYWDLLHVTLVAEKTILIPFSLSETLHFTHLIWVDAICILIENDTRHYSGWNIEAQQSMITSRVCRITDEIGRREVLLPIIVKITISEIRRIASYKLWEEGKNCNKSLTKNCCSGWMWLVDLNCNSKCDYNIGLLNCQTTNCPIHNNLGGELVENKSFF